MVTRIEATRTRGRGPRRPLCCAVNVVHDGVERDLQPGKLLVVGARVDQLHERKWKVAHLGGCELQGKHSEALVGCVCGGGGGGVHRDGVCLSHLVCVPSVSDGGVGAWKNAPSPAGEE